MKKIIKGEGVPLPLNSVQSVESMENKVKTFISRVLISILKILCFG